MKYEVYTITDDIETSILQTNDRVQAVKEFVRMQSGERCARLRIDGRQLTIREADDYVTSTRRMRLNNAAV